MTVTIPKTLAGPSAAPFNAAIGQTVAAGARLPDEVLIRIARTGNISPLELVTWQTTSRAFRRVCTDDAVWAGRAHRPADAQGPDATWRDLCELPLRGKQALAAIWRNARARRVPDDSREQLVHRQVAYAAHLNAPWLLPMEGSRFWHERPFVADLVRHGHLSVKSIPTAFAQDIGLMREVFAHDRFAYGRLPDVLKNDAHIAWQAVAFSGINLKDVPADMRTPALCRMALITHADAIRHVPEPMGSSRAVWLDLIPGAPELLYRAPKSIGSDPDILRLAIASHPKSARHIHWTSTLRSDSNFASFLVARCPDVLAHFDDEVRANRAVALAALHDPQSVHLVSAGLYDDALYALAMVQRDGDLLKVVSPRLRRDDTILRAAVTTTPKVLLKLPMPFRGRRDLVQLAVARDGSLLTVRYLNCLFGHDRKIVLSALLSCPGSFRHVATALRSDRDIVLLALRGDPNNRRYIVGDLMQRDLEIFRAAQNAVLAGFQFASDAVRDNRTEALLAVAHDGALLEFASSRLRSDPEIVEIAMGQHPHAVRWAAPHLRRAWRLQQKNNT